MNQQTGRQPPMVMCINDLSGVGKCSLTVALPILACMGVQAAALPTAILSTHTGGFEGFTNRDLTGDMLAITRHWRSLSLPFDAIYSGWLASALQSEIVLEIFGLFQSPRTLIFVDPVMGDHGKLYSTFSMERVAGIKTLCEKADLLSPNLTEACFLLGVPYPGGLITDGQARHFCEALSEMGPAKVVITGLSTQKGRIGAAAWDARLNHFSLHQLPHIPGVWHGTGDIFASVLLGSIVRGQSLQSAAASAVAFVHRCIASTHDRGADPRFGVDFELQLPKLMEAITNGKKAEEQPGR